MLAPSTKSETVKEIERRALEISAYLDRRDGLYHAEIVPDCKPQWHLLNIAPGKEDIAIKHLSHRGFGIFLPQFMRGAVLELPIYRNGRLCGTEKIDMSEKLIVPGRLFVFVWDILHHWRRIRACTGVQRVMLTGKGDPVVISEAEINRLQILQFSLFPTSKRKRKRHKPSEDNGSMRIETRSFWLAAGEARTAALDKAVDAH